MTRLAGVDGCKKGWICIIKDTETGAISSELFSTAKLLHKQFSDDSIIAVDIPIGLSGNGYRLCDSQAKEILGPRQSSVFHAPIRSILPISNHKEANEINKKTCKRGLSIQAFSICKKIREFDEILSKQPSLQQRIKEVHPELCFWAWNRNQPMHCAKKTNEGKKARHNIVTEYYGAASVQNVRSKYLRKEVADDDIYDAYAALWTAERIVRGEAGRIPDSPPCDETGLLMEMWF